MVLPTILPTNGSNPYPNPYTSQYANYQQPSISQPQGNYLPSNHSNYSSSNNSQSALNHPLPQHQMSPSAASPSTPLAVRQQNFPPWNHVPVTIEILSRQFVNAGDALNHMIQSYNDVSLRLANASYSNNNIEQTNSAIVKENCALKEEVEDLRAKIQQSNQENARLWKLFQGSKRTNTVDSVDNSFFEGSSSLERKVMVRGYSDGGSITRERKGSGSGSTHRKISSSKEPGRASPVAGLQERQRRRSSVSKHLNREDQDTHKSSPLVTNRSLDAVDVPDQTERTPPLPSRQPTVDVPPVSLIAKDPSHQHRKSASVDVAIPSTERKITLPLPDTIVRSITPDPPSSPGLHQEPPGGLASVPTEGVTRMSTYPLQIPSEGEQDSEDDSPVRSEEKHANGNGLSVLSLPNLAPLSPMFPISGSEGASTPTPRSGSQFQQNQSQDLENGSSPKVSDLLSIEPPLQEAPSVTAVATMEPPRPIALRSSSKSSDRFQDTPDGLPEYSGGDEMAQYVPDQKVSSPFVEPIMQLQPLPPAQVQQMQDEKRAHQTQASSSTVLSQASSSKMSAVPQYMNPGRNVHGQQDSTSSSTSNVTPPGPSPVFGQATLQQHSTSHVQHPTKRLTLVPPLLPFTQVIVNSSHIRTNDRLQEVISFSINIKVMLPRESDPQGVGGSAKWTVEKLYSDVLGLDAKVKAKHNRLQSRKLAQLPDKSLFKDHAPNKVDQRKAVLTKYLQSLVSTPLKDKSDICEFFNSNVSLHPAHSNSNSGMMEGHLTKKGRTLGGWQTRYYVLMGPNLEYFEQKGGKYIGQILITGASIGRQQPRKDDTGSDDSYRHAFLIRTAKVGDQVESDHILCAESDEERDQWVRALTCWVQGRFVSTDPSLIAPDLRAASQIRKMSKDDVQRVQQQQPAPLDKKLFPGGVVEDYSDGSDLEPPNRRHEREHSLGSASINSVPQEEVSRRRTGGQEPPPNHENLSQQIAYENRIRSNSALGLYEDQKASRHPVHSRLASHGSADELNRVGVIERSHSPDGRRIPESSSNNKLMGKISGPMNGAPIPNGYKLKADKTEERKAKTRSTFWGGFTSRATDKRDAQPMQPQAVPTSIANHPVFGVPLADAIAVARVRDGLELPAVVFRCVEYLEQKGAEKEEGIYRLSGSSNVIRALKDKFNTEGDFNICQSPEYYDPHAVAGLLKTFLRDLPQHILTRDFHSDFLQVIDLRQRKDKVNELGRLVAQLPLANYTLLRFLTAHLIHIVQNEKINKMTLRNVGIVFSPTLAMPAPLFSLLLSEFEYIFNCDDATGEAAPIFVEEEEQPKVVNHMERAMERRLQADVVLDRRKSRNSVLYSKTGANQLMEGMINKLEEPDESEDDNEPTEEDSKHQSDSEEGTTMEGGGSLLQPSGNFAESNSQRLQVSQDSPYGSPRSPRVGNFQGLPASPRPGATFSS